MVRSNGWWIWVTKRSSEAGKMATDKAEGDIQRRKGRGRELEKRENRV